jgi:hypothetical protein
MSTASTIIGYIASGLVLATFWTNDLRRLRMLAILSNVAFISYGALVWLPPVLGLHLLLLPLNAVRLMRMSKTAPDADHDRVTRKLSPNRGLRGARKTRPSTSFGLWPACRWSMASVDRSALRSIVS